MIVSLYKKSGQTPLEAINEFKAKYPKYKDIPMTYAGRLDPIAEGVLLILADDKAKEKDVFLKLDKKYKAEILFGFSTDSYDILGLPKKHISKSFNKESLKKYIEDLKGAIEIEVPPYSSVIVNKKPLFWWSRNKKISEISLPKRLITVHNAKLLKISKISSQNLNKVISNKISLVNGDFRQKETVNAWNKILKNHPSQTFQVAQIAFHCSSGTYIRSLATMIGKSQSSNAIILSLKRTSIGNFDVKNSKRV